MTKLYRLTTKFCLGVAGLMISFVAYGQQLKTSAGKDQAIKGHALYKQSKIYDSQLGPVGDRPPASADRAMDRVQYEFELLKDPNTGKIPELIREKELQFSKDIPTEESLQLASGRSSSPWTNRGPFNVGGRTRALAIDMENESVILAGGVSGGLWRSEDGGQTWGEVTTINQISSITCIVQDPRPGRRHIWYYGTGERTGNSAGAPFAFYAGNGVFKSTNGGRSFRPLQATADDVANVFAPFDLISNIAVHPNSGALYVSTWNGIFKSANGFDGFTEVLAGGIDNWTDIIITPQGTIYATIETTGTPNRGVFASKDGNSWVDITPEGFPAFFGRTVLGYTPSDENIVYAFSEDLLGGLGYLWRFTKDSPGSTGTWVDLSANLPAIGGNVGSLNTQTAYNLVVRVHPTDPNMVFIGGTNVYRSTTGFTTPAGQESWIGGYSPLNNISQYPDHHPDQHDLIFYKSNPNKALSANDGGVQVTEDITANLSFFEPVDWIDLNRGYITTQPYAFDFDPDGSSTDIVAGFQDNGTWFTGDDASDAFWIEDFSGDGSYNAISDGGLTRYVSSQFGNLFRLNLDADGNFLSFARVRPAGASGFSFVAPFILDKVNDNIMYFPAGATLWRNNDLDEIPLNSFAFATKNWVQVNEATVPAGTITALDVSKYPVANKLYYGTSVGQIFRMDNANIGGQAKVDVSTGKGLPVGGWIVNITVNPTNSDEVFAVFSNYGIPSLFQTTNGGETWTDIGGNLEQNPDGTGNGPSVRWFAIRGNNEGYFAGTSTGLYFAKRLSGATTNWRRSNSSEIGNAVVPMVKTRGDGFMVAASHGNGLFAAKLPVRPRPEPELRVAYLLDDYIAALNSPDTIIHINGLFENSGGTPIEVELTNSNPALVTAALVGNDVKIRYAADLEGSASIALIATAGAEQVAEGFTVIVAEPAIYEQVVDLVGSRPSQNFTDFGATAQTAADFSVPENTTWTLDRVTAFGGANNSPLLTDAVVVVYADAGGAPGDEVYNSGSIVPVSDPADTNLELVLPETAVLGSGDYWISVYVNLAFNPNFTQWFWSTQSAVIGSEGFFKDEFDLFGSGATDWTPASVAFGDTPSDQVFQLFGMVDNGAVAANSGLDAGLTELTQELDGYAVWPNPSNDVFNIRFKDTGKDAVLLIHNTNGTLVYRNNQIKTGGTLSWNASDFPTGIYFVHMITTEGRHTFKLFKD